MTAGPELHPRAMPANVTVRFALMPAGESTILPEQSVPPASAGDRWTAAAAFPVAQLPAGRYVLRAGVLQAGTLSSAPSPGR